MDGVDPLPDQDPTEGPNGDESARPGGQPEAGVEYLRNAEADCVHERLGPSRPKSNPALSLATPSRSPAGYTRERLTTRFHTASVGSGRSALFDAQCQRSPARERRATRAVAGPVYRRVGHRRALTFSASRHGTLAGIRC